MQGFQSFFRWHLPWLTHFLELAKKGWEFSRCSSANRWSCPAPQFLCGEANKNYGKAALGRRVDACAEGTLKLVIALAMTKLDVGVAGVERSPPTKLSRAIARGRFSGGEFWGALGARRRQRRGLTGHWPGRPRLRRMGHCPTRSPYPEKRLEAATGAGSMRINGVFANPSAVVRLKGFCKLTKTGQNPPPWRALGGQM